MAWRVLKGLVMTAWLLPGLAVAGDAKTPRGVVELFTSQGCASCPPADAAFEKLGKATLDDLAKPENKQKLADILKYHVVSGRVFSDQALKAGKAKTLQGGEVTIKTEGGKASVDAATLTTTDLDASNGVIHVIDSVILPK